MFSSQLRKQVSIVVHGQWKNLVRTKCDKPSKDKSSKPIDEERCRMLEEEMEKQRAKNQLLKAKQEDLCKSLGTDKVPKKGIKGPDGKEPKKGLKGPDGKEPDGGRQIKETEGKEPDSGSDESGQWRRPIRQQPSKVRLGFLPEDWFRFFYTRTGVTGPYVFMTTVSTYLISKEIYVMEHEYYWSLSILITLYLCCKYLGTPLAEYLDKEVDEYEARWNEGRNNEKKILTSQIEDELNLQKSSEGQLLLVEAKRENVGLQYEEAYRKRLVTVHEAVVKRLNYQIRQMQIRRRFTQENAVEWIVSQVVKSYTEKHGKEDADICIDCLKQLAAKAVA